MMFVVELLCAGFGGVVLWIVGMHVFDTVHWILHRMLESRLGVLRWLATPHAWHHAFLDHELRIQPAWQRLNFIGHLVPEYLTQLAASAVAALFVPLAPVVVCVMLQTAMFVFIANQRGLDINHRSVEMLDAYLPSILAMPAYHALHHVYPGAYFSAYSKLVDMVVCGGAWLGGKRVGVAGRGAFLDALGRELETCGACPAIAIAGPDDIRLGEIDILLLAGDTGEREAHCEAFVESTRTRQLPPEVWACQPSAVDGLALHYYRDPRVSWRALVVPEGAFLVEQDRATAARLAVSRIRRGAHFVSLRPWLEAWRGFRAFRGGERHPPRVTKRVRHRLEFLEAG